MQEFTEAWKQNIHSAADLVTKRTEIRKGFLLQAQQKNLYAASYITEAQEFDLALQAVEDVEKLIDLPQYRDELIAAVGFSDKARANLEKEELNNELKEALKSLYKLIREKHSNEGEDKIKQSFRQEILFRFLLTRGDSLGGRMRNVTGASASQKLAGTLKRVLGNQVQDIKASSITGKIQHIRWPERLLLFDAKPTLTYQGKKFELNKNIDVILIDTSSLKIDGLKPERNPERYIACGEIKGGIDPAGADEHWKTAKSALDRIEEAFKNCRLKSPHLFFIAAAIETAMANEIYKNLQSGYLSHAANLTVPAQFAACAQWLLSL